MTEAESVLASYLDDARRIITEAEAGFGGDVESVALPEELEGLRWFPLPNAPFIESVSTENDGDETDA